MTFPVDKRELPYHDNLNGNRLQKQKILAESKPLSDLGQKEREKWTKSHRYQTKNLKER
jgi:hypothetical protein